MTNEKTCCGVAVQTQVQDGVTYYWCTTCGKAGKGVDAASAWKAFGESSERVTGRGNFERVAMLAQSALERKAAPFIQSDHPALDRMIKKNVEYISSLSGGTYDAVWSSPEGRESLMKALEESIEAGATLPEMGCVVPYGNVAELIISVEGFRFALTTGASAPFEWINIDPVYQNDGFVASRTPDGQFSPNFAHISIDRGDLLGIVVYCKRKFDGRVIGEVYGIKMLDAMARKFSKPYQKAMRDIDDFRAAKAEGKTKVDAYNREYIEKVIKGKAGKEDWTKKIYLDEIDCPYTGPTAAKMFAKLAGKSFLSGDMDTRNSAAAIHEIQESESQKSSESVVSELINRTSEALNPEPVAIPEHSEDGAIPVKTEATCTPKAEKTTAAKGDDSLF